MKHLTILLLALSLSGCVLTGGKSDYDSHVQGRVEFKQSDDSRIASQAESIAEIAAKDSGSAEATAYKNALAMLSIAMLRNQDYGEGPPMTWTQVGGKVVDAVPFIAGMGGMYALGKEGIRAAGNVTIGESANVSGSLNRPTATNIGGQNSVTSAAPTVEVVEQPAPLVVEPQVVPAQVVQPVVVPGVQ